MTLHSFFYYDTFRRENMLKRFYSVLTITALSILIISGCSSVKCPSQAKYKNLNNVYERLGAGERLTIAYLGGSITWGATSSDPLKYSWRALTTDYLQKSFPVAHIKAIDAAIGGKGSELAVFRMDRDVTPYSPDLTFVEFAVNDSRKSNGQESMEGIIRKLKKFNSNMAIVIVVIGSGNNYSCPKEQEYTKLAEYYGLPCINIYKAVKAKIDKDKLVMSKLLTDGCHPNDKGYKLYAGIVANKLDALAKEQGCSNVYPSVPLTRNRFESAKMLELSKLKKNELGSWKLGIVDVTGVWFDHQPSRWLSSVIVPNASPAKLTVPLKSSGAGIYFETIRGGHPVAVQVDGENLLNVKTDFRFEYPGLGYQFKFIGDGMTSKDHKISLEANEQGNVKIGYLLYTRDAIK